MSSSVVIPTPFVVQPTFAFDGDDGSWSTFELGVGTPPQTFRVLPSTSISETWIPFPEGCEGILSGISICGTLRGVNDINGTASIGYEFANSSTWSTIGLYDLSAEGNLFQEQGFYGTDVLSLNTSTADNSTTLTGQTVAGVAQADIWLGALGLGPQPANFSTLGKQIPSLINDMAAASQIPSASYGYTAGAAYADPPVAGSLVLGGYDKSRYTPSGIKFPVQNTSLAVNVQSILGAKTLQGTLSLMQNATSIPMIIDSTVSQLWLPQSVCDVFARAFNLTYDSYNNLYLVSSSVHQALLDANPSVTFAVGPNVTGSATTNIVLPYAAFDLNASIPLYNASTPYFPIRRAANASQYVLGRAFLQEAYTFVDWEKASFTIGQAVHQNSTTDVVPNLSNALLAATAAAKKAQEQKLQPGVIAGIAVGAAALVIMLAVAAFFVRRSRRRRQAKRAAAAQEDLDQYPPDLKEQQDGPAELSDESKRPPELMSEQLHELHDQQLKHVLMSEEVYELAGHEVEAELDTPMESPALKAGAAGKT